VINLGYACINETLREQNIYCSRTMIKKTFFEKGKDYAADLGLENVKDLLKILIWNKKYDITLFRITSELFPWNSEYSIEDLKNFDEIKKYLIICGEFIKQNKMRVSFHPGQFNCLSSGRDVVIKNSLIDLENHGKIFDLMSLDKSNFYKINIHLGGTNGGDLNLSAYNFCKNFELLSDSVKSRLTVENDDKKSCFSTKFLYENIYKQINIPIVFDAHHYEIGNIDSSYEEAYEMAYESWRGMKPVFHFSNSKKQYEDNSIRSYAAHSSFYYKPFINCNKEVDLMLESKQKEISLFKYKKDFL